MCCQKNLPSTSQCKLLIAHAPHQAKVVVGCCQSWWIYQNDWSVQSSQTTPAIRQHYLETGLSKKRNANGCLSSLHLNRSKKKKIICFLKGYRHKDVTTALRQRLCLDFKSCCAVSVFFVLGLSFCVGSKARPSLNTSLGKEDYVSILQLKKKVFPPLHLSTDLLRWNYFFLVTVKMRWTVIHVEAVLWRTSPFATCVPGQWLFFFPSACLDGGHKKDAIVVCCFIMLLLLIIIIASCMIAST